MNNGLPTLTDIHLVLPELVWCAFGVFIMLLQPVLKNRHFFTFEVRLGCENDQEGYGAEQQMEEKAEGIRKDESGKARAVVPGGDDREGGAADGADERQEREEVPVLKNRLEQHYENAESAPNEFRQDEMDIGEGGQTVVHLAGAGPFERCICRCLIWD